MKTGRRVVWMLLLLCIILVIFLVPCVAFLVRVALVSGLSAAVQLVRGGSFTWGIYAWLLLWGDWLSVVISLVLWVLCIHGAVSLWQKRGEGERGKGRCGNDEVVK